MGNFLLGFTIGATIGALAVLAFTPKSGSDARASLTGMVNDALAAGRRAASDRERLLWDDFYERLKTNRI